MSSSMDRTGEVYARLTVIGKTDKRKGGCVVWLCSCSCGSLTEITTGKLGKTKSCGCLKRENPPPLQKTHGASFVRGKPTPEYAAWASMKKRCADASNDNYGGRGISVCTAWMDSFEAFLKDMGPRPSAQHSLDRIDYNGNYEPNNCRWATIIEQSNNKRTNHFVTLRGRQMSLTEAAREAGKSVHLVRTRVRRGWPIERALE